MERRTSPGLRELGSRGETGRPRDDSSWIDEFNQGGWSDGQVGRVGDHFARRLDVLAPLMGGRFLGGPVLRPGGLAAVAALGVDGHRLLAVAARSVPMLADHEAATLDPAHGLDRGYEQRQGESAGFHLAI